MRREIRQQQAVDHKIGLNNRLARDITVLAPWRQNTCRMPAPNPAPVSAFATAKQPLDDRDYERSSARPSNPCNMSATSRRPAAATMRENSSALMRPSADGPPSTSGIAKIPPLARFDAAALKDPQSGGDSAARFATRARMTRERPVPARCRRRRFRFAITAHTQPPREPSIPRRKLDNASSCLETTRCLCPPSRSSSCSATQRIGVRPVALRRHKFACNERITPRGLATGARVPTMTCEQPVIQHLSRPSL